MNEHRTKNIQIDKNVQNTKNSYEPMYIWWIFNMQTKPTQVDSSKKV